MCRLSCYYFCIAFMFFPFKLSFSFFKSNIIFLAPFYYLEKLWAFLFLFLKHPFLLLANCHDFWPKRNYFFFWNLFSKSREFATVYSPKIESLPKKSLKTNKENLNAIPFHASPLTCSPPSSN